MLRNIFAFIYMVGYLVGALPLLWRAHYLKKHRPEELDGYIRPKIVNFARRMLWAAGTKVEVTGLENIPEEATLTVFNHQSYFDAFIIIGYIPTTKGVVAKKELEKVPLLSHWMRVGGCLFIDRSSPRAGMQCIMDAVERLKAGDCVSIAPEGTRSKNDKMLEFKGGAFMMATKAEAPILPVCIHGAAKIFEGSHYRLTPTTVKVEILPAIPTQGLARPEQKALPELVKAKMAEVLEPEKE